LRTKPDPGKIEMK